MIIECCFRLTPSSTIIPAHYDSDAQDIIGFEGIFDFTKLRKEDYHSFDNYKKIEKDFRKDVSELMATDYYYLVLEANNRQYDCYCFDGKVVMVNAPGTPVFDSTFNLLADLSNVVEVGIEIPVYNQLRRTSNVLYRIAMRDGYVYTRLGRFKLPPDIEKRVTTKRPDHSIFKAIRADKYNVGYLFTDDSYIIIYGDTLEGLQYKEVSHTWQ